MLLEIFAMYDRATQAYMQPVYSQSKGEIIRSLSDLIMNNEHAFAKHPEDYTLFKIGTYEEQSGEIVPIAPEKVIGMWELKTEPVADLTNAAPVKTVGIE